MPIRDEGGKFKFRASWDNIDWARDIKFFVWRSEYLERVIFFIIGVISPALEILRVKRQRNTTKFQRWQARSPERTKTSFDFFHQMHCASPKGYLPFRKIWRKNNIGWESNAEGISHARCGKFPLWAGFSPRKPVFESLVVVFSFCYKYFCTIKKKSKLDIIAVKWFLHQ